MGGANDTGRDDAGGAGGTTEAEARGEPRMPDAATELLTIRSRLPDAVAPQRAWPHRVLARALNLAPAPVAAERLADARQITSLARSLARGERLEELLASQALATHAAAMSSSHCGMWRSPDDRIAQGHMRCAAQLFAVATRQNEMLKVRRERKDAAAATGGVDRIIEMTWAESE